ncbi:hypothetical protein [Bacillus benzoevorans]|uniref:Uncharacterized protein n=1 Tax=Bacillus benzoevorans TaxID=1456 RepID=A0A7X0HNA0_9BACI|nr:hypothetical protein [Bacillus benzoevorans]MBB6443914.1 hypothetical protein [Bacillus benzoevorans]
MNYLSILEYRLNDETKNYPAIYQYMDLNKTEIYCRRRCDYFIKEGIIYRKTSSLMEDNRFVIYVEEDTEEELFYHAPIYKQITLEIRFQHEEDSPLLYTYDLNSHEEAFDFIGNEFLQIGRNEYEVTAAEIDEDRSTYVLYVKETEYKFE